MQVRIYICNAFSLSMLDRDQQRASQQYGELVGSRVVYPRIPRPIVAVSVAEYLDAVVRGYSAYRYVEVVSAVGHADTARLFSAFLGLVILPARSNVRLEPDDIAIIGQYVGPRLPEGATELPEGTAVEWWVI